MIDDSTHPFERHLTCKGRSRGLLIWFDGGFSHSYSSLMDTVVFDIETANFFTDEEVGWGNFEALRISVVGTYSYERDEYACYDAATDQEKIIDVFGKASRLVGFALNRFDVPVLQVYLQRLRQAAELDLWKKERLDLLEEIELATGRRISLSRLAEANLGIAKDRSGAEAITLFKEGRMEELKAYCSKDVKLTKELYEKYRTTGKLLFPDSLGGSREITFTTNATQTTLF